jgi:DNA-binding MarR family transcriptional regulator
VSRADSADPPLTDHTVYLLSQLGRHGRRRLTAQLAEHELTLLDMAALAVLEQAGPIPHAELGRRLGLDPSDVTALVEQLSAQGRIERSVDPTDRRRRLVRASEVGAGALARARHVTRRVDDELLGPLPPDTRVELHAALATLLRNARSS